MLVLLSPAKKLLIPEVQNLPLSTPALMEDAKRLSASTRKLSIARIRAMMKLSDKLSELTHARFQALDLSDPELGTPAALTFAGDVYQGLDAASLSVDDLVFAQDSLRILSGLYGVLRPLDKIQPYRLEMGRKIKTARGEDLYDFWGARISKNLNADLDANAPEILNLASNEYFKAVDTSCLQATLVSPVFKEEKDGQQRVLSFFAKKARGTMARWIVENRIDRLLDISDFAVDGYSYCAQGSTPQKPLFVRPQPLPKAA